jgi:hypothetical protein
VCLNAWVPRCPMPAAFAALCSSRHTPVYEHGSLPIFRGLAKIQSPSAGNWVACFHTLSRCNSSLATVSDLRELSFLTSSTCCSTMPRSIRNWPFSQSTSDHRSAKHSEMRSPKHTHIRAIVLNGSFSYPLNCWNCSTVRLRGLRVRFVAPFTTTSSIGFRAICIAPHHMAKSMSM